MAPSVISIIVVKLIATCLSTVDSLYNILNMYKDSPMSLITISLQTTVISNSLSDLQTFVCSKQDFGQTVNPTPELAHSLDTILTGCTVLLSCLDDEIRRITAHSSISWIGKLAAIWNHERLRDLLNSLVGQQEALSLLTQLVQLDSLEDIHQVLNRNRPVLAEAARRTQSLKDSHSDMVFPVSIYSAEEYQSVFSNGPSVAWHSKLKLRKSHDQVLASTTEKALEISKDIGEKTSQEFNEKTSRDVSEEDLVDLSDYNTGSESEQITPNPETIKLLQPLQSFYDIQGVPTGPWNPKIITSTQIEQTTQGLQSLISSLAQNLDISIDPSCESFLALTQEEEWRRLTRF